MADEKLDLWGDLEPLVTGDNQVRALLEAQARLRTARVSGLLLFTGVEKGGTGDTVNLLNAWMDPRWLDTLAYGPPTDVERARPRFWRYWRDLPPHGELGLRLGAWYTGPLAARVEGRLDRPGFERALDEIAAFEELLAADGMLIIKFWMHLGRDAQRARLEALAADPLQAWRVEAHDWTQWRQHGALVRAGEEMILRTSTGHAPWHIIEGSDPRYRHLRVANILLAALDHHLAEQCEPVPQPEAPSVAASPDAAGAGEEAADDAVEPGESTVEVDDEPEDEADKSHHAGAAPTPIRPRSILRDVDMGDNPSKAVYERELARLQGRLNRLQRAAHRAGISTVAVFEGWDAAGKGGAIRRVTAALDARQYRVLPFAAPTDEERARHYLWRFWRHLGPAGSVTFFDRSWYGRVLVERIEGFATAAEWQRAYAEINHFEGQLVEAGTAVVKLWLHITPEEQAKRFAAREETPYKQWKITAEDWRNRSRWAEYEAAVHDMVERTSTVEAPWTVVPANHKRRARLVVLEAICAGIAAALPAGVVVEEEPEAAGEGRKDKKGGKGKGKKGEGKGKKGGKGKGKKGGKGKKHDEDDERAAEAEEVVTVAARKAAAKTAPTGAEPVKGEGERAAAEKAASEKKTANEKKTEKTEKPEAAKADKAKAERQAAEEAKAARQAARVKAARVKAERQAAENAEQVRAELQAAEEAEQSEVRPPPRSKAKTAGKAAREKAEKDRVEKDKADRDKGEKEKAGKGGKGRKSHWADD
ncbi:MAG: hypothetical protein H6701_14230 [Myxococcales bacterium]|nr:hypothetical protein [Myxococcales bacterium]